MRAEREAHEKEMAEKLRDSDGSEALLPGGFGERESEMLLEVKKAKLAEQEEQMARK